MKIGIIMLAMLLSYYTHVSFFGNKRDNDKKTEHYQEKDKKKKDGKKKGKKEGEAEKKNPKVEKKYVSDHSIDILRTWELPQSLKEISGMTFINEYTLACIQDESGEIFIYDLQQKKIIKSISFAGPGDYEGIANVNGTFYILKSDGYIIKADPDKTSSPETFNTGLSALNNCEGLYYDSNKNQLLIAIKADDHVDPMTKGIYSFNLTTMKAAPKPVAYIDLNHTLLVDTAKKKDVPQRRFHPSDLALNPLTKDYMIVNGVNSSLMILDHSNQIKTIISLDKQIFPQPEGIAYSPSGKLYISSEGGNGTGVIAECGIVKK